MRSPCLFFGRNSEAVDCTITGDQPRVLEVEVLKHYKMHDAQNRMILFIVGGLYVLP